MEDHLPEILERLKQLDPAKVILFGSHAEGTATEESDLDLMIVLNSDRLPQTYQDKEALYMEVAKLLRDVRRKTPVDLIVHTRPMHAKFVEMNSLFARQIEERGIVLYESHNA